ncbi:hypothetical protein DQ353_09475 [Arthrobacter sp. AQ5-05]|nr:hypothetical protein DQ353_09475 [Arthrobacter sp. AQ5-05]
MGEDQRGCGAEDEEVVVFHSTAHEADQGGSDRRPAPGAGHGFRAAARCFLLTLVDPGYLETDGNRLPVWATSMGRVLVVELPEAAREESLANAQLRNHTSKTVAGIGHLRAELDLVRAQGWSLVAQELDEGLRGLAVPVYRGAQLLGALNVSVQPGRIGSASITEEMLPLMRRTAKNIADDFGGRTAARN